MKEPYQDCTPEEKKALNDVFENAKEDIKATLNLELTQLQDESYKIGRDVGKILFNDSLDLLTDGLDIGHFIALKPIALELRRARDKHRGNQGLILALLEKIAEFLADILIHVAAGEPIPPGNTEALHASTILQRIYYEGATPLEVDDAREATHHFLIDSIRAHIAVGAQARGILDKNGTPK